MNDFKNASKSYSKALELDPTLNTALLNKANALLMNKDYEDAREDYITYLHKCPNDSQKTNIEEIIKLLDVEMERLKEEERLIAEANKPKWEQIDDPLSESADWFNNFSSNESEEQWEMIDSTLDNLIYDDDTLLADNSLNNEKEQQIITDTMRELNNEREELVDSSSLIVTNIDTSKDDFKNNLLDDNNNNELLTMANKNGNELCKEGTNNCLGDTIINNYYNNYNTYEGGYSDKKEQDNLGINNSRNVDEKGDDKEFKNRSESNNKGSDLIETDKLSNIDDENEYNRASDLSSIENNKITEQNSNYKDNSEYNRGDDNLDITEPNYIREENGTSSDVLEDLTNNDKIDNVLDKDLIEKKRLLEEAEEMRRKAQEDLDKKLAEHKKLSEEEQQKLNELAELEKKIDEYRRLAELEQQRLKELSELEKQLESNGNKGYNDGSDSSFNDESDLEEQRRKAEEENQKKKNELSEYEKRLEEERLALEKEKQKLKEQAEKQAEEQRIREEELRKQQEAANKKKESELNEEEMREQIRREMLEAEKRRRQQMLDDVANSLQNSSSTNMSSGTEDIIDYKFEGELD